MSGILYEAVVKQPACTLVAVLAVVLLLLQYFVLMAPRQGTLEWIEFTKRPPFGPDGVIPFRGAAWVTLPLAVLAAAARYYLSCGTELQPEAAAAALLAGLASVLTVWFLTGSVIASAGSSLLLFAFDLPDREQACILAAFLFLVLCFQSRKRGLRLLWLLPALTFAFAAVLHYENGFSISAPALTLPESLRPASLMPGLALPFCIVQAVRLHKSRYLTAFILGLLSFAGLFTGMPLIACWGCVLAFSCFTADAGRRGAAAAAVITYLVLVPCIGLIY